SRNAIATSKPGPGSSPNGCGPRPVRWMQARRAACANYTCETNVVSRRAAAVLFSERRGQRNFGDARERFRKRAVALGILGDFLERGLVDSRNGGLEPQRDAVDDEAFTFLGQAYLGFRVDRSRREACLVARERKRH